MSPKTLSAPDGGWIPSGIESPATKLVFLCLQVDDGVTVDELKRRTAMPKLTIHGVLRTLRRSEYVRAEGDRYYVAIRGEPPARSGAD